jgi:hypothetical protein
VFIYYSSDKKSTPQVSSIPGKIKIFNTINDFNNADKNKILNDFGQMVE